MFPKTMFLVGAVAARNSNGEVWFRYRPFSKGDAQPATLVGKDAVVRRFDTKAFPGKDLLTVSVLDVKYGLAVVRFPNGSHASVKVVDLIDRGSGREHPEYPLLDAEVA